VERSEEKVSTEKNHEAEEQQKHMANKRGRNGKRKCRKHKRSRITTPAHLHI